MENSNQANDKYSRKVKHNKAPTSVSKTVNLSPENSTKVNKLKVFLSKIVRDFIDSKDRSYLLANYSKDVYQVKNNQDRLTSSVTIRIDQLDKIDGVNMTALVNDLIEYL